MSLASHRALLAVAALAVLGTAVPLTATLAASDAASDASAPVVAPVVARSDVSGTAPAAVPTVKPARILGHHGAGALKLGDSAKQARRDGAHVASGPAEGCRGVTFAGRDDYEKRTDAYLQPTLGIVGIFARADMRTPEGIALGSTRKELEKAYPEVSAISDNGYRTVDLGGHRHYEFGMAKGRRVFEIALVDDRQMCFG